MLGLNPYALLGGLLLLIATYFGGVHVGKKLERETWQAEKIVLQNQHLLDIEAEVAKRARADAFNQAKARKATEDHEKALKDVADLYAARDRSRGLRIPVVTICRPQLAASSAAAGARRLDAGAAAEGALSAEVAAELSVRLPGPIENSLYAITLDADNLAEQLRALQGWVRDNGLYGPAPTPTE